MTTNTAATALSEMQRATLVALANFGADGTDGSGLAAAVDRDNPNLQGLHQTAASLVRRNLAERYRWAGRTKYAITPKGRQAVAEWA